MTNLGSDIGEIILLLDCRELLFMYSGQTKAGLVISKNKLIPQNVAEE